MTVEERALKFTSKYVGQPVKVVKDVKLEIYEHLQRAYIAGFNEAIKVKVNTTTVSDAPLANGIVWHKVADRDLPNDTRNVLNECGVPVYYVTSHKKWYASYSAITEVKVVAWCEIPTYEE